MLVFIDESGDPGFKIESGSSPIFVAAMVIFENADAAIATQRAIEGSAVRAAHKGEFKFSKCSFDVRDGFFNAVAKCPFLVRAIVVQKEIIYSPRLMSQKDAFYEYFVKSMISHNGGLLKGASVVIDGSGDREFRQNLNARLRRQISAGVLKQVRFKDSKNDCLVQLADMCAGAIARSCRTDRVDAMRWRKALAPRISNVWNFR